MIVASENGHVEVVDKLLQHGATVDLKEKVITTPICKYNDIYNHVFEVGDFSSSHQKLMKEYKLYTELANKFMPCL